jgi:hypothetical protein
MSSLPAAVDLTADVGDLIKKCKPMFADPAVTRLTWKKP